MTIANGLMKAILQMPQPLRRLALFTLREEAPELLQEIEEIRRLSVPWLQLDEARRTTMTGQQEDNPRFSAVVITAETDGGDYLAWPNFQIGKLPLYDLQLLELSLREWLEIVRREIASFGKDKWPAAKKEERLPDVDLADYD